MDRDVLYAVEPHWVTRNLSEYSTDQWPREFVYQYQGHQCLCCATKSPALHIGFVEVKADFKHGLLICARSTLRKWCDTTD